MELIFNCLMCALSGKTIVGGFLVERVYKRN